MSPEKYSFHESQYENPQSKPSWYGKNNDGGYKTLKYLRMFPLKPWMSILEFLGFFNNFHIIVTYPN